MLKALSGMQNLSGKGLLKNSVIIHPILEPVKRLLPGIMGHIKIRGYYASMMPCSGGGPESQSLAVWLNVEKQIKKGIIEMKKSYQVLMEERTHRELKGLAGKNGVLIGDAVEALLDFTGSYQFIDDEIFRKRFNALLETAFLNVGPGQGGFVGEIEQQD